ncbi:hypothetical protein [Blastococcus aggregatus]|uniref:hypothetical protein n=1 Tax=Blastococcus aggregatus TaxID=38502 RepID=UPI001141E993|nr:hypothetical protein [Blastococcus aggregatus]
MTARRWLPPLALLAFAVSACGADDQERLLEAWERDGRAVSDADLQMYAGPAHCQQDAALILSFSVPRESPAAGGSFVRDPEGVMDDYTAASFHADAELPDDALPTGYENAAGVELWLADDGSTAYLVDDDTVEAWPALEPSVCA